MLKQGGSGFSLVIGISLLHGLSLSHLFLAICQHVQRILQSAQVLLDTRKVKPHRTEECGGSAETPSASSPVTALQGQTKRSTGGLQGLHARFSTISGSLFRIPRLWHPTHVAK